MTFSNILFPILSGSILPGILLIILIGQFIVVRRGGSARHLNGLAIAVLGTGLFSTGIMYLLGQFSHIDCASDCAPEIPTYGEITVYSLLLLFIWVVIGTVILVYARRISARNPEGRVVPAETTQKFTKAAVVSNVVFELLLGVPLSIIGVLALAFGAPFFLPMAALVYLDAFLLARLRSRRKPYVIASRLIVSILIVIFYLLDQSGEGLGHDATSLAALVVGAGLNTWLILALLRRPAQAESVSLTQVQ
jgi:hypothetical protein